MNTLYLLRMKLISTPAKKTLTKLKEVQNLLKKDKNQFNLFNRSLKLLALLVNRLQVQGGANMTQPQVGGHCKPGKCRTSPFTTTTTTSIIIA